MTMKIPSTVAVKFWQLAGIGLEKKYDYTEETVEPLPKHSHRSKRFWLKLDSESIV